MIQILQFELSKEFLERFRQAVEGQEDDFIQSSLDGVNPADITELLEEFDADDSKYVLDLLETEIAAGIISELDEDTFLVGDHLIVHSTHWEREKA